jgi:hypothetical protein
MRVYTPKQGEVLANFCLGLFLGSFATGNAHLHPKTRGGAGRFVCGHFWGHLRPDMRIYTPKQGGMIVQFLAKVARGGAQFSI